MAQPPLRLLHSEAIPSNVKLEQFRRLSTAELIQSLRPGAPGALEARPDGAVLDGHHRLVVLRERPWRSTLFASIGASGPGRLARHANQGVLDPWALARTTAHCPTASGGEWLDDDTRAWREAGIDVMVSLLEPREEAEFALTGESASSTDSGIEFRSFPRSAPESVQAPVLTRVAQKQ